MSVRAHPSPPARFRWTAAARTRQERRVIGLLASLAALAGGGPAWAATVTGVAVAADRIAVRFDEPVKAAAFAILLAPDRIALDVTGLEPGGALDGAGPVRRMRERAGPDGTRLEFELARPARVADARFDESGRSLTLSLRPVGRAAFAPAGRAAPPPGGR